MSTIQSELTTLGNELGAPRWVQGPGGNVSIKHEGVLYVKASGTRLATVGSEGGHVGVPLDDATRALEGDAAADKRTFERSPRPSLETYFHALGGRVVAHTHPVAVLLVACSSEPFDVGFAARVPYERPGRGLAQAIAKVSGSPILLESHGLLVYAESVADAVKTSKAIEARCLGALDTTTNGFEELLETYEGPNEAIPGGFLRRLPPRAHSDRYLFPDAVVYASVFFAKHTDAAQALSENGRPLVVVDGAERVAVAKSEQALESCIEVLAAHDWVEDMLVRRGSARYLDEDEPAKILGLPSEQYRLRLQP